MTDIEKQEELAGYVGDDKIITFQDKRELLKEENNVAWLVGSGFPSLDIMTRGFRPGNLVIVSAPTSNGKTTFLQSITKNITDDKIKSLWFPFEGNMDDFLERLDMVTVQSTMPATLKSSNVEWIHAKVAEAVAKHGVKVVFIDHLHYLLSLGSMGNASLTIGHIVRQLKLMAKELNVVVFLVCHIKKLQKRDAEGNIARPSIDDLRDSSFIGQESDYVILMWRKQSKQSTLDDPIWLDRAKLSLQKNRRTGKLGNFDLIMNDKRLFEEEKKEIGNYDN